MEEIINKIIEIDRQTKSVKLQAERTMEQRELELKEKVYNLEKESIIKTKAEGEAIYRQIIDEGEAEVTRLENSDIESLIEIDKKYNDQKMELTERLFENLFLKGE